MASQKIRADGEPFGDILAKIYYVAKVKSHLWVIVAERLQKLSPHQKKEMGHAYSFLEYYWKHRHPHPSSEVAALSTLEQAGRYLGLDLSHDAHGGNWGLRNGKLVYFDFGSSEAPSQELPNLK